MNKTYIIIDSNNLCWRNFYALGDLSFRNIQTGIAFGFLRDIVNLQELLNSTDMVFCFDMGESFRTNWNKDYKANREKNEQRAQVSKQIRLMRMEYLPALGFSNIFAEDHFEADDLMASLCLTLKEHDDAVLVSSDRDLYQLLNNKVRIWDPRKNKPITRKSFKKEYGVPPSFWPNVKALAGCKSDNIKGIPGVGEKGAIAFLRDELSQTSKKYQAIMDGNEIWEKNLGIVTLPYPGTPKLTLKEDTCTRDKWLKLVKRLGMDSLQKAVPMSAQD